jgi:type IV secretory pathway VirB10-like protein
LLPPQVPAPAASGAALLVPKAVSVKSEEIHSPATSSKASGAPPGPVVSSDSVGSGQAAGGTEVKTEAVVEPGAPSAPAAEVETPRTDSAGSVASVPSVPDTEYTYRASSFYRAVPIRQLPATPKPALPGSPAAPPTPPPPPVSREDREARVDWGRRREATPSEESHDDRPHDIKKRKKNKGAKKRERGRNWFHHSQSRGDRGGGHPPGGSSSAFASR